VDHSSLIEVLRAPPDGREVVEEWTDVRSAAVLVCDKTRSLSHSYVETKTNKLYKFSK